MQIVPEKLKIQVEAAKQRGVSLNDIMKAAGYESERRITQLMEGKSTNINPRIGEAIAKKLKCKTSDISA